MNLYCLDIYYILFNLLVIHHLLWINFLIYCIRRLRLSFYLCVCGRGMLWRRLLSLVFDWLRPSWIRISSMRLHREEQGNIWNLMDWCLGRILSIFYQLYAIFIRPHSYTIMYGYHHDHEVLFKVLPYH